MKVRVLLLHLLGYLATLVIDVVNRYHSWTGLLVTSLFWKLAWHFVVARKLVLREGGHSCQMQLRSLVLKHLAPSAVGI